MKTKILAVAFLSILLPVHAFAGEKPLTAAEKKAESAVDEIIEMRSALAGTIKPGSAITEKTFMGVCGAVAKRVKEMAAEGIKIRHAATKNRNPLNAATDEEALLIKRSEESKGLKEVRDEVKVDGSLHRRYVRPIYVEKACLACHGERDKRPAFIVEKYPGDKAYGFSEGDLRAIIYVTTPK